MPKLSRLVFFALASILFIFILVFEQNVDAVIEPSDLPSFSLRWGSGNSSADGEFYNPWGITTDSEGYVYVVDSRNHRIQKFTADGTYLTQWGSAGSGDGQFDWPNNIALDGVDNIYVLDRGNDRIQKFTTDGTYLMQWNIFDTYSGWQNIAVDKINNYVYVTNLYEDSVQKFTTDGTYLTQWGSSGSGDGQFDFPTGIDVDDEGNVYVMDSGNDRIQKFSADGTYLMQWGSSGSGNGQFNGPYDVAIDTANSYIYVADTYNNRVQKFGLDGTYLGQFGSQGYEDGQFVWDANGIVVNFQSNIYVLQTDLGQVQYFTYPEPTPTPTPEPTPTPTPEPTTNPIPEPTSKPKPKASPPKAEVIQIPAGSGLLNRAMVTHPIKDSNTKGQSVLTIIFPETFNFNAYLSANHTSASTLSSIRQETQESTSASTNTGNLLIAGYSGGELMGFRQSNTIYWQVGGVQELFYKAYPAAGKSAPVIVSSIQDKPSIIALKYTDSDLIPPGEPDTIFDSNKLRLAHSTDGLNWQIIPSSVVDTTNKTVAAIARVGGYYTIVGRY